MNIEGVILVLSCQKHIQTRLKEFRLKNSEYEGWKVIYVIGDLFLDREYRLQNDLLIVKTEDSYVHLLKKLVLSIKYLRQIYTIRQGILRCGDDLIFNEINLIKFLNATKTYDFLGFSPLYKSLLYPNREELKKTRDDYFIYDYYSQHPEDFLNPQHNLKGVNIQKYIKRPDIYGAWGALYYISNYSCEVLVNKMEEIGYDIFHYDTFSKSYPYTIEDVAVSYILYLKGIPFIHDNHFVADNTFSNFSNNIAVATNKYK
jgi:hypothetical protein